MYDKAPYFYGGCVVEEKALRCSCESILGHR